MDHQQKSDGDRPLLSDKSGFRKWAEAGFLSDLLPIIPPHAKISSGSQVKDRHRGKTPGVRNSDGTWSGLGGKWPEERFSTVAECKKYILWGASVGLQGRKFPGLDIDVESEAMAGAIESLALEHFGMAPVRVREGSPRRLMVYRVAEGHDTIRKTRLAWKDAQGVKHAAELLAFGQQYVVEGPHPKGGAYLWRHNESPCDCGPAELAEITSDAIDGFFTALRGLVHKKGWGEIQKGALAGSGVPSTRKGLDDASLWASKPSLVLEALQVWPNSPDTLPSHDDFVTALAAIKAALGPKREDYYSDVLAWAMNNDSIRPDYVRKRWDSINDAALGAAWLFATAKATGKFDGEAQEDFDEDGDAMIAQTPLEKMISRYVWVQQLERYIELETGAALSGRALNAANVQIAAFGNTGVKSAEAHFQNARGAKKAQIATFRPGRPVLIEDENQSGVKVRAVNLWRPSPVAPLEGVTDEMVAPWLEHVTKLFGEPGDPAREHFLNFFGFVMQHPGVKINHAPVILGNQGVGKDTVIAPVLRAAGRHNVSLVKPQELASEFTQFLQAQIIVVSEMMNFAKREIYNQLKDWIAAPPDHVVINKKNQQPFAIPNTQTWIFFTNYDDAIALDPDDRRFWVHRCHLEEPLPETYYTAFYRWINEEQGAAKVAGWLKSRDVSTFNPGARPPTTDAKQQMLDRAQPPALRWLRAQFGEGEPMHGRTIITAEGLITVAREDFAAPDGIDRHAVAALKAEGFKAVRRVRIGSKVRQVWAKGSADLLAQLPPERLRERLEAEGSQTERTGA
ncbi:DUF5906 domain-containing protein [Bradyrhizobium sp. NP1]|uniref:DUF5906 domain-containing protein n=1 Tax=Bradyrhizobium sp. NP1 TaxID=3049772 RepID=UPI0025A6332C|nr:DUF5906 domain-containing protein [Bradyrhizobium sp. NP1]WJR78771.1 DUF5906 domain-containing protein [Bradyrhizobium sp. NP1]